MGGPASSDIWRAPSAPPDAFCAAARRRPERALRIGRISTPRSDVDVHPDCLAGLDRAAQLLTDCGHEVVDVPAELLPSFDDVRPAVHAILTTSIGLIVEQLVPADQRHLLMPYTRWLAESDAVSGLQLSLAQGTLARAAAQYAELLRSFDLVISPTTTAPPVPIADLRCDDGPESLEAMARWSAFTPAANIAGTPAVNLPVHVSDAGLPIGVQLSGPAFSDELLVSVAAQVEEHAQWHEVHPTVWND